LSYAEGSKENSRSERDGRSEPQLGHGWRVLTMPRGSGLGLTVKTQFFTLRLKPPKRGWCWGSTFFKQRAGNILIAFAGSGAAGAKARRPSLDQLKKLLGCRCHRVQTVRWPAEDERYRTHCNQSSEGGRAVTGPGILGAPLSRHIRSRRVKRPLGPGGRRCPRAGLTSVAGRMSRKPREGIL